MTSNQPLSLFISSKMQELAVERRAIQTALNAYKIAGWLWEDDAGARPEPIRSTYLKEVEACDIYLGLFWRGYGPYTIEEFAHARRHNKPCLIYEKHEGVEQRSPELTTFLTDLQRVNNSDGLTIYRFQTPEQLAAQVQVDVMRLLTTRFRESRQQPSGSLWTVPYRRNPFFTGRESLLKDLHDHLTATRTATLTQPQAISGLGGIGKTNIAVEYAYRHEPDYRAVLWVNAATRETVIADYVTLAAQLQLPEKEAPDQTITVAAVKDWLENTSDWLLIFDNADDLALVEDFLPVKGHGHLLLTTRAQAPGTLARSIEVEEMDTQEGTLLLLRRAKVLAPNAPLDQASLEDRTSAEAIVHAMDGLPLALDQAGAYIEETACGLVTYLERYQHQPIPLLQRRGVSGKDHPLPVAKTWSLSFGQVEGQSPAAADLLHLCAFLAPDAIPEELMVEGARELTPPLQPLATTSSLLDEAIAILRRFSLLRRNPQDHTLWVHRLVQAILRASLSEHTQQEWAERTVRAVNQAFPTVSFETWPACQRCLPHAHACADLITHYRLVFPEAADLLNQAATYMYDRGLYTEAEPLYQGALEIREQVLGAMHPDTAISLNNLARLYHAQGKYEQAEPLLKRALEIREQVLGAMHPDTAISLNNLALLYDAQGKYEQAEPLLKRALQICEQVLGATHPDTALIRENYAELLQNRKQKKKGQR
jgi:hypothetical protein